jgi:5'-nucleotidase
MKKNILITNDDGYKAPGINALAKKLSEQYNVFLIAPESEKSACSSAMTIGNSLTVKRYKNHAPFLADCFSISGTPVDCVKLGLDRLINVPISFVISGINHGINSGIDIHYSGTVGAALEAYMMGYKAIAFSVDVDFGTPNYEEAAKLCMYPFELISSIEKKHYLFNVNIPASVSKNPPNIKYTRLNWFGYEDNYHIKEKVSEDKTIYIVKGQRVRIENEINTDYVVVKNGEISITPLKLDLTDYKSIEEFSGKSIQQLNK